jgi:hypothetical protein
LGTINKSRRCSTNGFVYIVAYLSPTKIPALRSGQEVKEFYVLQVQLKQREQQSEWKHASEAEIPLKGLSFDDVWNNIVAEIGSLDNSAEETLEQQIINREEQ